MKEKLMIYMFCIGFIIFCCFVLKNYVCKVMVSKGNIFFVIEIIFIMYMLYGLIYD